VARKGTAFPCRQNVVASPVAELETHTEAVVMMVLMESEHSPWSRAELERELRL
jgi:hypothetical protein